MRQIHRQHVCVRDSLLGMGLCFLLEVQVGRKSGIFSLSQLYDLLYTDLWCCFYCFGLVNTS